MNQPLALAQMDMNPVGSADFPAGLPALPTTNLTQKQKAAVIVQLLLVNGADLDLADMPDEMQEDLTFQLASLRRVDGGTLHTVVEEFVRELKQVV